MDPLEFCRLIGDEVNVRRLSFKLCDSERGAVFVVYTHQFYRLHETFDLEIAGVPQNKPDLAKRLLRLWMDGFRRQ